MMRDEPEATPEEAQSETATGEPTNFDVPMDAVGQCKPGDTLKMKVVSVDAENGTVTVEPQPYQRDTTPDGSDAMASEIDKPEMEEQK